MTRLLIHACCAPCTTHVYDLLKELDFELAGFFYNPNIYPAEEFSLRKKCMEYYSAISRLPVAFVDDKIDFEPGNCANCYELRLRKTARHGKENGFDLFTTTLLISPYQKHEEIKRIGEKISEEEGIGFFYHDFRDGFKKSRERATKLNLYRQKYCGCEKSAGGRA